MKKTIVGSTIFLMIFGLFTVGYFNLKKEVEETTKPFAKEEKIAKVEQPEEKKAKVEKSEAKKVKVEKSEAKKAKAEQSKEKKVKTEQSEEKKVKAKQPEEMKVKAEQSEEKKVKAEQSEEKKVKVEQPEEKMTQVDQPEERKVEGKRKSDKELYANSLSEKERKVFLEKEKKKIKVEKVSKETIPDVVIKQNNGSVVKIDEPIMYDSQGFPVKIQMPVEPEEEKKKTEVNIDEIINSMLRDENGNLRDMSLEGMERRAAQQRGISYEEYKRLEREGYFDQGKVELSPGRIGDGSPEDDAGMR